MRPTFRAQASVGGKHKLKTTPDEVKKIPSGSRNGNLLKLVPHCGTACRGGLKDEKDHSERRNNENKVPNALTDHEYPNVVSKSFGQS